MQVNILVILVTYFWISSNSLLAADGVTHPITNEPFVYFQIDQCEATKAYGNYWHFTEKGTIVALSDICINEEQGTVKSYEPRSGYILVEKSKNGKKLEILDSSNIQALRTNLTFINMDCNNKEEYYTFIGQLNKSINIPDAYGTVFEGYTIPSTTSIPAKQEAEFVFLSLHMFSQAQLPQQTTKPINSTYIGNLDAASFTGNFSVSENSGTFSVTEGGGHSVGEASGKIELKISPEGVVAFSGNVIAKNQRLAGHTPGEWITLTAEFPFMRGHLLGTEGNTLKAYGIAKGQFVDTNGHTHPFHARATFLACFRMDRR